jgi:ubiquinol-cytochrome c reductase subunit 8
MYHTALSSFRQNPMQGAFKHSVFQGFSRIVAQVPYFLVPMAVGALCFLRGSLRWIWAFVGLTSVCAR